MEGAAVISSLLVKGTLTMGGTSNACHIFGVQNLNCCIWYGRWGQILQNWLTDLQLRQPPPSLPSPPTPHPPLPDIPSSLSTVESLGFNLPFRQSLLNKWFSFFVYRPLRSHININYSTFLSSLIKYGKCQQRFGKWQEISLVLKMFVLQEND